MKSSAAVPATGFGIIAGVASLGALLTLVVIAGAEIISWSGRLSIVWWREILYLVSRITGPNQGVVVVAWVLLTGGLIAIGAGISKQRVRPAVVITTLLSGAFVAIGLVLFGETLSGLWPSTDGPDPVLTILLLAYSLVVPWGLGRVMARLARVVSL